MPSAKDLFPAFLDGIVTAQAYARWLHRNTVAHSRRDRLRSAGPIATTDYKTRVHAAVQASAGMNLRTGEALN